VFTDIVGSTAHIARIGDSPWLELLARHDALVEERADAFGGRVVNKLGDGFFLAFDTPVPAIRFAQSACTGVRALGLEIRAGAHLGNCELLGDIPHGMAVHVAHRLSALAGAGEVLVSGVVRDAVAGSDVELSDYGTHALRGVPGEWQLFMLSTGAAESRPAHATPAPPPLPPRLVAALEHDLVGRSRELDRLGAAWRHVLTGERRASLISGEPGIGKTRLAAEVGAIARAAGAPVLYGRCDRGVGVPYQPVVEALDHYARHAPAALLARQRAEHGTELGRLVPSLSADGANGAGPATTRHLEGERYVLVAAVCAALEIAAAQRPVLLILDDLHWADTPTLLVARGLLTAPKPSASMVIATYRSTELTSGGPLAELVLDLAGEPGILRLELPGLEQTDVIAIARSLAGAELDDDGLLLARAVHEEAGGNPFFATEIMRHVSESGQMKRLDGRGARRTGGLVLSLPGSVRETVTSRVQRLGAHAERVLEAAAVIGHDFGVELLARVVGESEDELVDVLDAASACALVREAQGTDDHYSFTHALIPHTLYERLGPARRRLAHRRVAEALEAELGDDPGPRIGELAHHACQGCRSGDAARALEYARQAARRP
jgi:AAA ATPase-like protein